MFHTRRMWVLMADTHRCLRLIWTDRLMSGWKQEQGSEFRILSPQPTHPKPQRDDPLFCSFDFQFRRNFPHEIFVQRRGHQNREDWDSHDETPRQNTGILDQNGNLSG